MQLLADRSWGANPSRWPEPSRRRPGNVNTSISRHRLLRRQTAEARPLLGRLLEGRLTFTPHPDQRLYTFNGVDGCDPGGIRSLMESGGVRRA